MIELGIAVLVFMLIWNYRAPIKNYAQEAEEVASVNIIRNRLERTDELQDMVEQVRKVADVPRATDLLEHMNKKKKFVL